MVKNKNIKILPPPHPVQIPPLTVATTRNDIFPCVPCQNENLESLLQNVKCERFGRLCVWF